jgi:uncharacterized protein (UPF0276 family)
VTWSPPDVPWVGLALHADEAFLGRVEGLAAEADLLEVTPEQLWRRGRDGALAPNGHHAELLALTRGRPVVAHGVLLSLGSVDAPREAEWLARIAVEQAAFGFRWYTDHHGYSALGERAWWLPLPLPATRQAATTTRARLERMAGIVPLAGLEDTAHYAPLDDREPELLGAIAGQEHALLLDLHNVHVTATNAGVDPRERLERVALEQVVEVHLAGGSTSEPGWVRSGRRLALDSHDAPVADPVWALLEHALARCPRLAAVVVERVADGFDDAATAALAEDLRRARDLVRHVRRPRAAPDRPHAPLPADAAPLRQVQEALVDAVVAAEPWAVLEARRAADPGLAAALARVPRDGLELTATLVRKLRLERLLQGSLVAGEWFAARPEELVAAVRRYHLEVPPSAVLPVDEARAFDAWLLGQTTIA